MNLSKLEKIVKSDTRYYKQDNDDNCSFTIARLKERIQAKFDKIYALKRTALLIQNVSNRSATCLPLVEEDQRMISVVEVIHLFPHELVRIR